LSSNLKNNPSFWWSYGKRFPEGRGNRKPSRDFYIPLEAFVFGEMIL
jgi:hypothetical protein